MSTLSRRTRTWVGTCSPGNDGVAFGLEANASAGVLRPIARWGLTSSGDDRTRRLAGALARGLLWIPRRSDLRPPIRPFDPGNESTEVGAVGVDAPERAHAAVHVLRSRKENPVALGRELDDPASF